MSCAHRCAARCSSSGAIPNVQENAGAESRAWPPVMLDHYSAPVRPANAEHRFRTRPVGVCDCRPVNNAIVVPGLRIIDCFCRSGYLLVGNLEEANLSGVSQTEGRE